MYSLVNLESRYLCFHGWKKLEANKTGVNLLISCTLFQNWKAEWRAFLQRISEHQTKGVLRLSDPVTVKFYNCAVWRTEWVPHPFCPSDSPSLLTQCKLDGNRFGDCDGVRKCKQALTLETLRIPEGVVLRMSCYTCYNQKLITWGKSRFLALLIDSHNPTTGKKRCVGAQVGTVCGTQ